MRLRPDAVNGRGHGRRLSPGVAVCAAAGLTVALAGVGAAVSVVRAQARPAGTGAAGPGPRSVSAEPEASPLRIEMLRSEPAGDVPRYGKFEVSFTIAGTAASMLQWPHDASPPRGVPAGVGISVDAVFADPSGREYRQPAFYYQHFEDDVRNGRDWRYPTDRFEWKVRFAPNRPGAWKYKLVARDRRGSAETEWKSLTVVPSASHGFVRVSQADRRYFEFDDGAFFSGLGLQVPEHLDAPVTRGAPLYQRLQANGINFARLWISSLFGASWTPWVGGRNQYGGYLPISGIVPFRSGPQDEGTLVLRLDYEAGGDTGWFDACRLQWADEAEAVKPNTRYRVRAVYAGRGIVGPRAGQSPRFGFVVKMGGMFPNCYEPGTSQVVSSYGSTSDGWSQVDGTWFSGNRQFLPKIHLALENVRAGAALVRSVSVREVRPDGAEGPEVLTRPSMEAHLYVPQARAHAFDTILEQAERQGVYLKLVVMEKGDEMYQKFADDGSFVTDQDNANGVYGTARVVNRTRWLQQAWWRYLQARWGYSPAVHSWELLNEGDPASTRHYELAEAFGQFMHYRVFGVEPGAGFDHPDDHLVTTSFWHSFPAAAFWANAAYPHVDYADLHAYVSTSTASPAEKQQMQSDTAFYHLWHSRLVAAARVGKPVVRGEAGLDTPGRQDEQVLGVQRDRTGQWLHDFLWAGLDSGALHEVYWWRSHVWNGQADHRGVYKSVGQFLDALDLNKGGYSDWGGSVSSPALRVVGQKNAGAGAMHLWIQNTGHTWRSVLDGRLVEPASGTVRVPGFRPRASFDVEWWDTYAPQKTVVSHETVSADPSGTVSLAVTALETDVAVMLRPRGAA